jgi:PPOX class probable F420-dependent enzyme
VREEIMIDKNSEAWIHMGKRLQEDLVIWLTTVSLDGTPQPNPVWFYWNGEEVILYSKPRSFRIRNLELNPRVALNFEGADVMGGDVAVITGRAAMDSKYQHADPGYVEKYLKYVNEMGITIQDLEDDYSVEIRVTPLKARIV